MTLRFTLEEVQTVMAAHAQGIFIGEYAPKEDKTIGCSAYDNAGDDLDPDAYFECFVG